MRYRAIIEAAALLALVGAAAFEAAVALQWIPVGTEPGGNARFEGLVMTLVLLALVAGIVDSLVLAIQGRRSVPAALFPIAAALMMIARYYTFDTYYLPDLTRYSESDPFPPSWVYGVALASLPASLLSVAKPRLGFVLGAAVLFLCLATASLFGIGK